MNKLRNVEGTKILEILTRYKDKVKPLDFIIVCEDLRKYRNYYGIPHKDFLTLGRVVLNFRDTLRNLVLSEEPRGINTILRKEIAKVLDGKYSEEEARYYGDWSWGRPMPIRKIEDALILAAKEGVELERILVLVAKDFDELKKIFKNLEYILTLYKFKTDPKLRRKIRAKLKKLEKLKPKEREKELKRLRKEAFESVAEFR